MNDMLKLFGFMSPPFSIGLNISICHARVVAYDVTAVCSDRVVNANRLRDLLVRTFKQGEGSMRSKRNNIVHLRRSDIVSVGLPCVSQ